MMRIAEALEAFRPHRGDAIVVPGRGGRYWIEESARPDLDAPLGDPAMAAMPASALASRWRGRSASSCCSIPREIS